MTFDKKPLLYYFDPDQIHDLIGWNLCSSKIAQQGNFGNSIKYLNGLTLSANYGRYSFFEGNDRQQILIQRFTPWAYPWAEHYSTKLYEFINYYTGTDIYDRDEYTNNNLFASNSLRPNFGTEEIPPINLPIYEKPLIPFTLTVPVTLVEQLIIITWLELEEILPPDDPCLIPPSAVYLKKHRVITTSTQQATTHSLPIEKIAYCSVVVSCNDTSLKNLVQSQFTIGCLYENFDALLLALQNIINNGLPRLFLILNTANYSVNYSLNYATPQGRVARQDSRSYSFNVTFTSYSYRTRPDYYRSACLLYANNNRWNNGVIYQDLGKKPTFYKPLTGASLTPLSYCFLVPYSELQYKSYNSLQSAEADGYPNVRWLGGGYHRTATSIVSPPFEYPRAFLWLSRDGRAGGTIYTNFNPFYSYVSIGDGGLAAYQAYAFSSGQGYDQNTVDLRNFPNSDLCIGASYSSFNSHENALSNWLVVNRNAPYLTGWKSLIRNASGVKHFLYAVGSQFRPDWHRNDPTGFTTSTTGKLLNYKINCTVTFNADSSFAVQGGSFSSLGEHQFNRPPDTETYDVALYHYFYNDSGSTSGQITYNYFLNDSEWASNPLIIDSSEPVYRKMSDAEVIAIIDTCMPSTVLLEEILECCQRVCRALDAQKFSRDDNSLEPRVANLGYYIERIARVLGISVNANGTIRSIRQKRVIPRSNLAVALPDGWNFGQWGLNRGGGVPGISSGQLGGNPSEYRDGIIYEQRSNKLEASRFNPNEVSIKAGDYTLCENIPQLLDEILDDLDKGIGWQELGAGAVPNADGSGKHCTFEGLAQLLTETAYMMSRVSQHTSQTQVATLVVQAVAYEILRATGQPLTPKSFQVDVGGEDYAVVPYPGLAPDAPSQMEQTSWILQNLAPILGAFAKINAEEVVPPPPEPGNTTST